MTVFGMPLEGTPLKTRHRNTEQRPIEGLQDAIRTLIERDDVDSIRWRQYTPYFNDGDECVFSVHEPYVKVIGGGEEDGDYGDGYISDYDVELKGGQRQSYDPATRSWKAVGEPLPPHPVADDFRVFANLVNSGAFEDALYEAFGDHCTVTVFKDKIMVDEYSHD